MKKAKRAFSSNINSKNLIKNEQPKYNLEKSCLLNIKAQVVNSKLIHRIGYNGDYVEYWIEVITDYKKWIVKKRYSEFYDLNQKINQKIPEINKLFPPKRFFKNSEDTIEERKICFNKYLNFLFKKKNIFSLNEVLDFIQMDKKILELYIKKHTMVRQDQDNCVFQSLKRSFNHMIIIEKKEKSKSVGENMNITGLSTLSSKINSKEELNRRTEPNINNINSIIIDSCDAIYDIEESNYFSSLLEFEKTKNIDKDKKGQNIQNDDNINHYINNYEKEAGNIVIEEFLKNLSQDIDNKTDIIRTFEEFLKKGPKWPYLSNTNIIKLFVGNINNSVIYTDKKWSFCSNKLSSNQKSLSGNNINKIENENKLSLTQKSLSNLGDKKKDLFNDFEKNDNDNTILKGLFYYIGNFENNILLSFSCLDLLSKLLDNEFNPEVELYLKIFKTRRMKDYQCMRLEEIIKNNMGGPKATKNAFKLLSILMEDKNKELIKKMLIKDEIIFKQLSIYNHQSYE